MGEETMTKCSVPNCLGHADQKTVEVACVRCHDRKWVPDPIFPLTLGGRPDGPPIPLELPYTCVRCRAVLAGRNAVDPLVPDRLDDAKKAARAANLVLARAARWLPGLASPYNEAPKAEEATQTLGGLNKSPVGGSR
jgi:hypothetical protein